MPDIFGETIKYNPIKSTAYRDIKIIINHCRNFQKNNSETNNHIYESIESINVI